MGVIYHGMECRMLITQYKDNGINQIASLVGTTKETTFKLNERGTYFVTALNKKNAESDLSESVTY